MASQYCLIYVFKEKTLKPIALVMLLITGKMCLNKEYRTSLFSFSPNLGNCSNSQSEETENKRK